MSYEPREGVDYIVDLYQVAGVERDSDGVAVKQALIERLREYHPDRLEGLAPEFRTKGEAMARLLNRARVILLDDETRNEYDQILEDWEGPVSSDGTPIIRIDDALRAEAALKSPEELETTFSEQRAAVASMVKYDPKHTALLRRLHEGAEDDDADELREAYDAALFAEDQILAIEEAERSRLLGLPAHKRYETVPGYAEHVQGAIEAARDVLSAEHRRRVLGGVSGRLALLAGEILTAPQDVTTMPKGEELPPYFDDQARKIADIAAKREALLEKRLEIFQPTYPIAEVQTEAKPNFVVGITNDEAGGSFTWIGFSFDPRTVSLENIDVPEGVRDMLAEGEYERVYRDEAFNILTFVNKEHIELRTLLEEAYNKHLRKYFPEAFED